MARAVLASELLSRLRQVCDAENDTHLTDAELYRYLTSAVSETWELLTHEGLGDEGIRKAVFTTTSGTLEYPLSSVSCSIDGGGTVAGIADFWKVKTLYVSEGNGQRRPISRVGPNEQRALRAVAGSYSMTLCYIPCAPTFSTGAESFDGINGWEEHVIQTAAITLKAKKEDDTGQYRARKRELEDRMRKFANRSNDEAPTVVRRYRQNRHAALFAPYNSNVTAWDIRGGKLELYYEYGCYT